MAKVNPVEIQKYLGGVNYPVSKQDLIQHAQSKGADENIKQVLEQLPDDKYETPADVSQAIGKLE